MTSRRALVLGATGQTGSYMVEWLLVKGYKVYALVRRGSTNTLERLRGVLDHIEIVPGDVTDSPSLVKAMQVVRPTEIYNFAAQSHVGESFITPIATGDATGLGAVRVFEAARTGLSLSEAPRIYQASSSEMFGEGAEIPQRETTPLRPRSPYGCAKAFAHMCAQVYRLGYGMWISCGIAYNHESERRGESFVTRKITKAIARIKAGQQDVLHLGNVDARRDWMHAIDVVWGAWLALQHHQPEDFVFATGVNHSVQEFLEAAFQYAGLDVKTHVKIDPLLRRPLDISALVGDARKARELLGWSPTTSFTGLIERMVDADCAALLPRDPVRTEG